MIDVSGFSPKELLTLHATVAEELRSRGITRSSNNPTGDLAEYLFCKAFGWSQAGNSNANIDATAPDGMRYQIKGRRMTRHNKSRQLSGIRDFQGRHFDYLAGAVFMESYEVFRAAIIPYEHIAMLLSLVQQIGRQKAGLKPVLVPKALKGTCRKHLGWLGGRRARKWCFLHLADLIE
jgi:hypothetical protein